MLSSIGGNLEQDRALRMMIALLILAAMLNGSNSSDGSNAMLDRLNRGSEGAGVFLTQQVTMTSISVQQTTSSYEAVQQDGPAAADGPRLDIVA